MSGRKKSNSSTKGNEPASHGNVHESDRKDENNDKDEAPCMMCTKMLKGTDVSLQCDRCDQWACIKCLKISQEVYKQIARPDLRWFCELCVKPALQSVKTDKAIEERCKQLLEGVETRLAHVETEVTRKASVQQFQELSEHIDKKYETLSDEVKALETKVNQLSHSQSAVDTKLDKAKSEATLAVTKDMKDKERRAADLILFKVPISEAEEHSTRRKEDEVFFEKLCKEGLELKEKVNAQKIFRLGKSTDAQRPMKVQLDSEQQVENVTKSARKLSGKDDLKPLLSPGTGPL